MSNTAAQQSNQAMDANQDSHILDHLKPLKSWEELAEQLKQNGKASYIL
jgi:hypothetical protein